MDSNGKMPEAVVPLENLQLKVEGHGITQTLPALSDHWLEPRNYVAYEPPELNDKDGKEIFGAKERWLDKVACITENLEWLLSLPQHRFWCQVINDSNALESIVPIFLCTPSYYDVQEFPNDADMREALSTLKKRVLQIYVRLSTTRENDEEFMIEKHHGHLLYKYWVFTGATILDLCQHYGRGNTSVVVRQMLSDVFRLQPKYFNDMMSTVGPIVKELKRIRQKFQDSSFYDSDEAVPLSQGRSGPVEITLTSLKKIIVYLLDITTTLSIFFEVFPEGVATFHKSDFMSTIVSVYEVGIPQMYDKLEPLANQDEMVGFYIECKHRLDVIRVEIMRIFRTIIYKPIENIIEERNTITDTEIRDRVNEFLDILNNTVPESFFIYDYSTFYSVTDDLETLSQLHPELDSIKCEYITQSVKATIESRTMDDMRSSSPVFNETQASTSRQTIKEEHAAATTNNEKSSIELSSLISKVKDILCHLGEGFIERCLKHYNYDTEAVINAVLEDTLHSSLKELDFTLPYIPPDPMEASAAVDDAIGGQRLNVFDNDEFDIMTRDVVDKSRIHRGKKREEYKDLNEMLNDKSHGKEVRQIYEKYRNVADDYDDEYDDTYDSQDIGLVRDDPLEIEGRPFTTPRVLRTNDKNEVSSADEDDQPELEYQRGNANKDHFLQDPAELRAKAEQRRYGSKPGPKQSGQRDVVGNARGQGQEKQVLANRDHKNTHKASRANHNRRSGSQWKKRQGMVPS